jgi:hypothetical protein
MCQFSGLAILADLKGCPIRRRTDRSFIAAPRSFSQLFASFIAITCQGIHHTPFPTLTRMICTPASSLNELAIVRHTESLLDLLLNKSIIICYVITLANTSKNSS